MKEHEQKHWAADKSGPKKITTMSFVDDHDAPDINDIKSSLKPHGLHVYRGTKDDHYGVTNYHVTDRPATKTHLRAHERKTGAYPDED